MLNGAEIRFDEAYNVFDYALLNNGALDPNAADVFGAAIPAGDTTAAEVVSLFYNDYISDLGGFFQANLSGLDTTPTSRHGAVDPFRLAVIPSLHNEPPEATPGVRCGPARRRAGCIPLII